MKHQTVVMLGLTLAMGTAVAKSPTTPAFYELDVNGDGKVTRAELSASGNPELVFGRIDTDKDGGISVAEYAAAVSHG